MKTEKEKMLAGELYNAADPQLVKERQEAHGLCLHLNRLPEEYTEERSFILEKLFQKASNVFIQSPFFCDYGYNIKLGKNVYFNFNCVILDVMPITIGSNVLIGPSVQIYTASHPLDADARRTALESAKSIEIGDDVWIGGGSIICPGVKIGARSVIGAGSIVTKDIPEDTLAAGNPCRVIRQINTH